MSALYMKSDCKTGETSRIGWGNDLNEARTSKKNNLRGRRFLQAQKRIQTIRKKHEETMKKKNQLDKYILQ